MNTLSKEKKIKLLKTDVVKWNAIMKVYVLIWWFYEGDSNLVNSFEGVFSNYDKAMFRKNEIDTTNRELVSTEEAEKRQYEHGSYGDPSYFEIRECII